MNKKYSLYIHIPFCQTICSYCDFCKVYYQEEWADKYLITLEKELKEAKLNPKYIRTVYFGGGTPTSFSLLQLRKLFVIFKEYLFNSIENTIEVNPETINLNKIQLLKEFKINRVSLGVQTFDDVTLKYLNRNHHSEDIEPIIKQLKDNDINNISIDLIYGYPQQSLSSLQNDIAKALKLDIKHISLYPLTIEKNTILNNLKVKSSSSDSLYKKYNLIKERLKEFNHYEISNFALKGYESKHNLVYWRYQEYYALGPSAVGIYQGFRYENSKNVMQYLRGNIKKIKTLLTSYDKEFEYIMLNLRLKSGIKLNEYKRLFKKDFNYDLSRIKKFINKSQRRICVKSKYWYIINSIIVEIVRSLEK
ncbi:MAG: radical SAM family heme chaperone HemW [Bacillales bacterium]|nr:radical SAM family heme chaperone HemW [Bacillales bacterium]